MIPVRIDLVPLGDGYTRERLRAWRWIEQQPVLYSRWEDRTFSSFCRPDELIRDFAIFIDGIQVALFSLYLRGPGSCEIALITPPRLRRKELLCLRNALSLMQNDYFTSSFGKHLSLTTDNPRALKMARLLGWREEGSGYAVISHG